MYLQGDLQAIFDALYHLGVIDPVLEMDWSKAMDELPIHHEHYEKLVEMVNCFQGDKEALIHALELFDDTTLGYLAMEVAREFADFHARDELH